MLYNKILGPALVPTVFFLLLSLVSVAITTHYWVATDWFIPHGVRITTNDFDDRTQSYRTDYTIVYFKDPETDATIAAGVLCLAAAVTAIVAWFLLRRPSIDTQFAAGKRRFWVLAVVVMTATGAAASLASLVLHYTMKGNDGYGCDSETLMMGGKLNTNKYCTREMAFCNFLPEWLEGDDRYNASIACNETVTIKWLQLVLIVNALVVLAMFSVQAQMRRTTRDSRTVEPPPKAF
ncbi:hypothetical protein CC86DRAFT_389682 [Ophiobolus disseminans]|uniref:MARVEL domain-containing protein n=1 Tax=Ophiobolus disseminans TaxID=1469910 RepID=A0A6A7ALH7_9PLEO|nr:hypothetical protein CC86DRAFT_389682 [Ophiobolus disseminans]